MIRMGFFGLVPGIDQCCNEGSQERRGGILRVSEIKLLIKGGSDGPVVMKESMGFTKRNVAV